MRTKILEALKAKYKGDIAAAQANIEIYLTNPVGIGEHPDVLAAIDDQVSALAGAAEKLEIVEKIKA